MSLTECTFCCWWRKPKSKLQTRTSEQCQSKWGLACELHTDSLRKWIIWFLTGVWSSLAWRRWRKQTGKGGIINVAISATNLSSHSLYSIVSLCDTLTDFTLPFSLPTPLNSYFLLPSCLPVFPSDLASFSAPCPWPSLHMLWPPFLLYTPLACLKSLWPVHSLFY